MNISSLNICLSGLVLSGLLGCGSKTTDDNNDADAQSASENSLSTINTALADADTALSKGGATGAGLAGGGCGSTTACAAGTGSANSVVITSTLPGSNNCPSGTTADTFAMPTGSTVTLACGPQGKWFGATISGTRTGFQPNLSGFTGITLTRVNNVTKTRVNRKGNSVSDVITGNETIVFASVSGTEFTRTSNGTRTIARTVAGAIQNITETVTNLVADVTTSSDGKSFKSSVTSGTLSDGVHTTTLTAVAHSLGSTGVRCALPTGGSTSVAWTSKKKSKKAVGSSSSSVSHTKVDTFTTDATKVNVDAATGCPTGFLEATDGGTATAVNMPSTFTPTIGT